MLKAPTIIPTSDAPDGNVNSSSTSSRKRKMRNKRKHKKEDRSPSPSSMVEDDPPVRRVSPARTVTLSAIAETRVSRSQTKDLALAKGKSS